MFTIQHDSYKFSLDVPVCDLIMFHYSKQLKTAEEGLEKLLQIYLACPESHPKYSEEWKSFWTRRKAELAKGKNRSAHLMRNFYIRGLRLG